MLKHINQAYDDLGLHGNCRGLSSLLEEGDDLVEYATFVSHYGVGTVWCTGY